MFTRPPGPIDRAECKLCVPSSCDAPSISCDNPHASPPENAPHDSDRPPTRRWDPLGAPPPSAAPPSRPLIASTVSVPMVRPNAAKDSFTDRARSVRDASTVTVRVWVADRPSGSDAVTVTVAAPILSGRTVSWLPVTSAVATSDSDDTAA